jgi:hypothetical protein
MSDTQLHLDVWHISCFQRRATGITNLYLHISISAVIPAKRTQVMQPKKKINKKLIVHLLLLFRRVSKITKSDYLMRHVRPYA